jgi:predicted N-formylglutamate amidohydrolase
MERLDSKSGPMCERADNERRLLETDEPPPVTVTRPHSISPVLIACDHASNRLPRSLESLGLSPTELTSHIAWDIGALQVAMLVAEELGATLISQNYSRLAIDCNRSPTAADSIASCSDGLRIGGNENLTPAARERRRTEIFSPYHAELARLLKERQRGEQPTVLIALHSFTPQLGGNVRPWHVGLMYAGSDRLGSALLALLRGEADLLVGDNEPYAIDADIDYTLPQHGAASGIPHVGIEIRQDLIGDPVGQRNWAAVLARLLPQAAALVLNGALSGALNNAAMSGVTR